MVTVTSIYGVYLRVGEGEGNDGVNTTNHVKCTSELAGFANYSGVSRTKLS